MLDCLPPSILTMWLGGPSDAKRLICAVRNKWESQSSDWYRKVGRRVFSPLRLAGMFWLNWKPSFKLEYQYLRRQWRDREQHPGPGPKWSGSQTQGGSLSFGMVFVCPLLQSVCIMSDFRQLASLTASISLGEHWSILSQLPNSRYRSREKMGCGNKAVIYSVMWLS